MDLVPLDSVEGDRQGLVALFNQCNGENWKGLTDKPIEEWFGVQTNVAGRLLRLGLTSNNLSGSEK